MTTTTGTFFTFVHLFSTFRSLHFYYDRYFAVPEFAPLTDERGQPSHRWRMVIWDTHDDMERAYSYCVDPMERFVQTYVSRHGEVAITFAVTTEMVAFGEDGYTPVRMAPFTFTGSTHHIRRGDYIDMASAYEELWKDVRQFIMNSEEGWYLSAPLFITTSVPADAA